MHIRVISSGCIADSGTISELIFGILGTFSCGYLSYLFLSALYADLLLRPQRHPVLIAEPAFGWDEAEKDLIQGLLFKVLIIVALKVKIINPILDLQDSSPWIRECFLVGVVSFSAHKWGGCLSGIRSCNGHACMEGGGAAGIHLCPQVR